MKLIYREWDALGARIKELLLVTSEDDNYQWVIALYDCSTHEFILFDKLHKFLKNNLLGCNPIYREATLEEKQFFIRKYKKYRFKQL